MIVIKQGEERGTIPKVLWTYSLSLQNFIIQSKLFNLIPSEKTTMDGESSLLLRIIAFILVCFLL